MKKYEIWFAKDNSYCDYPDNAETTSEFKRKYVTSEFKTNDEDAFWCMYLAIRLMPPSMWYWVFLDGKQILSGAIDPGDLEWLEESIEIPQWVKEEADRWSIKEN